MKKQTGAIALYAVFVAAALGLGSYTYGLHQKVKSQRSQISELESINARQATAIKTLKEDREKIDRLLSIERDKVSKAEMARAELSKKIAKLRGEDEKVKTYLSTIVPADLATVLCGAYGERDEGAKAKADGVNANKTKTSCFNQTRSAVSYRRPGKVNRGSTRRIAGILRENGHVNKLF